MAMTPDTPVFHAKDSNGLSWSFDPATGKWAVQGEGEHSALKASSQKLEVLVAKAIDWSQAQKDPPAPPKESFEVEMLMAGGMSFQDGLLRSRAFAFGWSGTRRPKATRSANTAPMKKGRAGGRFVPMSFS